MRIEKTQSIIFAVLFFSFAFFCLSNNIPDPDIWWHVKLGMHMLEGKGLLPPETYTYTGSFAPWINHEIGSELFFGWLYRTFGGNGILLTHVISLFIFGIIFLFVNRRLKAMALLKVILSFLAISVMSYGMTFRPQIFSYLFFTLLIYLLEVKPKNYIFFIPVIFALWANCHGGFLMGLCVLGIYSAVNIYEALRVKKNAISYLALPSVLLVSAAATLATPYGLKLWRFLIDTVNLKRPYLPEWWPVNLFDGSFTDLKGLVLLFVLGVIALRKIENTSAFISACFIIFASFRHNRHLPFAGIMLFFVMPPYLDAISQKIRPIFEGRFHGIEKIKNVLFAVLVCLIVAAIPLYRGKAAFKLMVPHNMYPVEAVNWLKTNNIKGNCACFFDWGEYIIWHLGGKVNVSVDGRLDTIYTEDVINMNFAFVYGDKGGERLLTEYPTNIILIHAGNPVARIIERLPEWKLVHKTNTSLLYLKAKDFADKDLTLVDISESKNPQKESLFP